MAMAYWGGQIVRTTFLPDVAWPPSPVNLRVLLFTLCVALATGLLAGMAPAWKGAEGSPVDSLKEGGRGGTGRRTRGQAALLVTAGRPVRDLCWWERDSSCVASTRPKPWTWGWNPRD